VSSLEGAKVTGASFALQQKKVAEKRPHKPEKDWKGLF
jgi:hypothetical protein